MSTATPFSVTTDTLTDRHSTSQTSSLNALSSGTAQLPAISTASAVTTQSSTHTGNMFTSSNISSASTSIGSLASASSSTTTIYTTTTDHISGNSTTSGYLTSVLYGSSETTRSSAISTSKFSLYALSTQTTKPSSNDTTAVIGTAKHCPEPLRISGGKLLSTGPYIANVSTAVYSCLAGYTLTGQAEISCSATGTWDPQSPKCVQVNKPNVDNHISLGDSTKVPLWLTVILCLTFGLLCLLLLVCLLMYCLKIFGCWKGSSVGTKIVVRESGIESSRSEYDRGRMTTDDFRSNHGYNRPKFDFSDENGERSRRPREQAYNTASRIPVKSTEQAGKYTSGPHNPYNSREGNFQYERGKPYRTIGEDMFYRREMQEGKTDQTAGNLYRREAKMPAKQTWMPHSHKMRSINTSTK